MGHPATLGSRYRVLDEMARGGMGVVYLVEHLATGKRHAAKAMLAQLMGSAAGVERFLREVRAPARIDSEHVVEVIDVGSAPELSGVPFLVMELLDGRDLAQLLRERGHLSPAEVVSLLRQLASALDRAHAVGIVHRDLKPSNLFLHRTRDGRTILKVLDFGLATALGEMAGERPVTRSGDVMGTPQYMAPEQARGHHAAVGPATDVWAVGMIAFELLSGQPYWAQLSTAEVIAALLTGGWGPPSELVPGLGAAFDAWFVKSCHADPSQRFAAAGEQVEALSRALGTALPADGALPPTLLMRPSSMAPAWSAPPMHAPLPHTSAPLVHSAPRLGSGTRWGFAAAAVLLLAVGATAALLWKRPFDESESAVEEDEPNQMELYTPDEDDLGAGEVPVAKPPASRPPGPWIGTARVQGGLYEERDARAVIEPRMHELRACYLEALKQEPELRGQIELMIRLDERGVAQSPPLCAKREGVLDRPRLCNCLYRKVQSWRFPPPEHGIGSFFYGLLLEPR